MRVLSIRNILFDGEKKKARGIRFGVHIYAPHTHTHTEQHSRARTHQNIYTKFQSRPIVTRSFSGGSVAGLWAPCGLRFFFLADVNELFHVYILLLRARPLRFYFPRVYECEWRDECATAFCVVLALRVCCVAFACEIFASGSTVVANKYVSAVAFLWVSVRWTCAFSVCAVCAVCDALDS